MHIGVIGAGAWGTALAAVASNAGNDVSIWAREEQVVADIQQHHRNSTFLSDAQLPPSVYATAELDSLASCDVLIHATPTQFSRVVLAQAHKSGILDGKVLVTAAKGIELGTHKLMKDIVMDVAPTVGEFAVLSGPSHAEEVARNMPTTVVCACENVATAEHIQHLLHTETFRVYTSTDVVGVEVCGALKNVIAIAAGIVDGVGLGDNTKAALLTRGLAEMSRIGIALGASVQTFYGLAGMGDLIVTAGSKHSRNRYVGEQVGLGKTLTEVLATMQAVAEGVATTKAALELAESAHVELPITQKVAEILFQNQDPLEAIRDLMLRPLAPEAPSPAQ